MEHGDTRRLRRAFDSAEIACRNLREDQEEDRARLAQLMTIWASGYLEAACRQIVSGYAERRATPGVVRLVNRQMQRFTNPKMDRILDLVRGFEREKADELEAFAGGEITESVNSIVGIRNDLAHGRRASVSVGRIVRHFERARRMTARMEKLLA